MEKAQGRVQWRNFIIKLFNLWVLLPHCFFVCRLVIPVDKTAEGIKLRVYELCNYGKGSFGKDQYLRSCVHTSRRLFAGLGPSANIDKSIGRFLEGLPVPPALQNWKIALFWLIAPC
jgi:hypothetical protein